MNLKLLIACVLFSFPFTNGQAKDFRQNGNIFTFKQVRIQLLSPTSFSLQEGKGFRFDNVRLDLGITDLPTEPITCRIEQSGKTYRISTDSITILYDPAPDLRAYIRQYILIGKGNAKQLVLRVDEGLRYIAYNVCLHDAHNNVFRVMKVRELIKKEGYTEPVDLPAETAYISLALSAVDGKKIRNELEGKITRKQWIMFALASVATDLLCVLVGKLCIGKIYGGIYWEGYVFAPSHLPAMCGICAAVIVINIAVTYLYIKLIVLKRGRR